MIYSTPRPLADPLCRDPSDGDQRTIFGHAWEILPETRIRLCMRCGKTVTPRDIKHDRDAKLVANLVAKANLRRLGLIVDASEARRQAETILAKQAPPREDHGVGK